MSTRESPRSHLLLPWAVQEREDPVLEFDHAEGVYFFDRQGRRYLDFLAQVFHCTLGHGNQRQVGVEQEVACALVESRGNSYLATSRHTAATASENPAKRCSDQFSPSMPKNANCRSPLEQVFGCHPGDRRLAVRSRGSGLPVEITAQAL